MTDTGIVPDAILPMLDAPHVSLALLGYFDFPSGVQHLWTGVGTLRNIDGHDWLGLGDPGGNRVIGVSEISLPEPNAAIAIEISMSGIDQAMVENIYMNPIASEGREAELFIQVFDGDDAPVGNPISIDPQMYMTQAKYRAKGTSMREVAITLEGTFSAKNFPPGAQLTDSDTQRRSPGDLICKYVGWTIEEVWSPSS